MGKRIYLIAIASCLLMLCSCSSKKDIIYLQDMVPGQGYDKPEKHEAVIHTDDRLDIVVRSKSPELAQPFNSVSGAVGEAASSTGYRVDKNGYITFPILGELHVEGKTVSEVENMIRDLIIEGQYIKDPMVTLNFKNFKYTVLGAAGSTGVFTVDGDRVTLLEAIAKAGDIAGNGRYDNVAVIREENGQRVMYEHDLRSKDIFNSPCFYLQQNDVIYVEPKYKKQDKEDQAWKWITTGLSVVTATCTVIWAIRR